MTVASIEWSSAVSPTSRSILHISSADAGRTTGLHKNSPLATTALLD